VIFREGHKLRLPIVALVAFCPALVAAAPVPSSPDNETTALQPPNEALMGILPNSIGTTTDTGTPAQSAAQEYQPGSRVPPPNVLAPLGPVPVQPEPPGPPAGTAPRGHSLSGNVAGMAGAVDASAPIPLNPYVAILGSPGKNPPR